MAGIFAKLHSLVIPGKLILRLNYARLFLRLGTSLTNAFQLFVCSGLSEAKGRVNKNVFLPNLLFPGQIAKDSKNVCVFFQ